MQIKPEHGTLRLKDGKIVCPCCKRKTDQAVSPGTRAENLELWCRRCKTSFVVNIEQGACSFSLRTQK